MEQPTEGRWERPDAPLGTLVFRAGLLSKEKLETALIEGRRTGKRLGEVLLNKGWIDEKDLARLVAGQKGVAFVSLRGRGFDKDAAKLLPERLCRGNDAVAVEDTGVHVVVAVADPTDDDAVAELSEAIGRPIELVVATASEIHEVLDDVFRPGGDVPLVGEFGLRLATTPEPAAEEPVADEPVAEETVAEEPVAQEPVAEEPVAEEPVAEEHVAEEPVADEPVAEEPVAEEPVAEEPVAVDPMPEPTVSGAIELPKLHTTPLTAPPEPRIEIIGLDPKPEDVEPEPLPQSDALLGIADPSEPTIERNEDAHVSLAFHSAPLEEPEPEPEPEPVAAQPEPAAVEDEIEIPPMTEQEMGWRIVLNLRDDDEIDVAFFATEAEANAAARELVAGIAQDSDWPQVGRKFIPPDRINSVEVRERARFGGSRGRAEWGNASSSEA